MLMSSLITKFLSIMILLIQRYHDINKFSPPKINDILFTIITHCRMENIKSNFVKA